MSRKRGVLWPLPFAAGILLLLLLGRTPMQLQGKEPLSVEFYYENVCASCSGDADFYQLIEECLSPDEKAALQGKITTYNVFLDSCRERYEGQAQTYQIPEGTSLPVLIVNGQWASGLAQMEPLLREAAGQSGGESDTEYPQTNEETATQHPQNNEEAATQHPQSDKTPEKSRFESSGTENFDSKNLHLEESLALIRQLEAALDGRQAPVLLLFTTEACEDCEAVKDWLNSQPEIAKTEIIEYNIIKDPCLDFLKALFRDYGLPEQEHKVPALFYGTQAKTGASAITALAPDELAEAAAPGALLAAAGRARTQLETETPEVRQGLLTLAGAGLLAGLNPCSISMLLMLLSIMVAEKASVWKNGLLYLGGKYAAYFTIGLIIYFSAAGLEGYFLAGAGRILNIILILLFLGAGILYGVDAVRIFRQDYGKIRTQLPTGMRRWNHNLIRRAGSYTGILKPLLILGLGMAISVGEFFCTGQIYMASITYLLRDGVTLVWLYFLVYVTAMSLPAFLMLAIIQKTRNTEHISEFMLRHLGAVKIFNALLFFGYALYFLFF